ncbi:thermonuclease family protein [Bradyrhizobium sp. TM239]|uniref:thermonuclease family protein n=1 Tax=Bradyrhizobium sp. TM239 TaxID=2599802 RepID=UPI0030C6D96F
MRPFNYAGWLVKRCLWNTSLAVLTVGFFSGVAASESTLVGVASVIDGDTIEIHGHRVRLFGIDAPESGQLCRGGDSLQYRCGSAAANKLGEFIGRRTVSCTRSEHDRYGRIVGKCSVDETDLAEWLVRNGYALDWPKYSKGRYAAQQASATAEERGMWAGSFVIPWRYRECMRGGGIVVACSDQ